MSWQTFYTLKWVTFIKYKIYICFYELTAFKKYLILKCYKIIIFFLSKYELCVSSIFQKHKIIHIPSTKF